MATATGARITLVSLHFNHAAIMTLVRIVLRVSLLTVAIRSLLLAVVIRVVALLIGVVAMLVRMMTLVIRVFLWFSWSE